MSHWYNKAGEPAYEIVGANKKLRPTTLRDARKYGYVPSVTTILGLINKDALNRWKINEVLLAVIDLGYTPQYEKGQIEDWKRTILGMSEKKSKDAADKGSQIHDALEQYYLHGDFSPDAYKPELENVYNVDGGLIGIMEHPSLVDYCRPVVNLLDSKFKNVEWIPEASFRHPLGFGGKCDLHLKPCSEFPEGVIIDFKTKSTPNFASVKAYAEQCQQLVAYRHGFNIPKAECYNLFIGTNTPGELLLHEWKEGECINAWKCFVHLVEYWKYSNRFNV